MEPSPHGAAVTAAAPAAPHGGMDITPFIWLLLIASIVAMLGQRLRVPYALALVITGLLVGAPHLLPQVHLEPHVLFTVFLPPLLFESALNLRADQLRRNWQPVAAYAVLGTGVATLVVGAAAHWALGLPPVVALVFGALIVPTDPISVIAIFKRLGVPRRLALLVEAESLFNDGVAVVLFTVLLELALGGSVTLGQGILRFLLVVAGGAGVGLGIGILASLVTRYFNDHLLEITLTTIVAFGSYLVAEALHVSGVIAVVAAGLVVGNFGVPTGMSPSTRLSVFSFWEYAAFAANSIVFLLVGIEVTYSNLGAAIGPVAIAVAAALAGRAAAVYLLSPLVNRLTHGSPDSVPLSWQHVLFWGGLKGALPMALVLGLGPGFPQRERLVVLTFGVVLFSLLAQGLTMERLLKRLRLVERRPGAGDYERLAGELLGARAALAETQRLVHRGLLPRAATEPVAREYEERIGRLEAEIDALQLTDEALRARQLCEARRLALLAEKSALQEARLNGLMGEEELREVLERIDGELADQQAGQGH